MGFQCKYAKRQPNKPLLVCTIMEESCGQWFHCGNQRYCPKEGRTVLTDKAENCPVRMREEAKKNAPKPEPTLKLRMTETEEKPKKKRAKKSESNGE